MIEVWKKIPGFEGRYWISNLARVKSSFRILKKTINVEGYEVISFRILGTRKKKQFKVHKLLWEMFVGEIPTNKVLDHTDRNRSNNLLSNLRLVSYSQNVHNSTKSNSKYISKFKGVRFKNRKKNCWEASFTKDGKRHWLGTYNSEIKAAIMYDLAAIKLAGIYVNTNLLKVADNLYR